MKVLNTALGMVLVGATGLASADSLFINDTGFVGIGTNAPNVQAHVFGPAGGGVTLYKLEQTDAAKIRFIMANPVGAWSFDMSADAKAFTISKIGTGEMFKVNDSGQLFVGGNLVYPPAP